jgi:hypothetical protein
MGKPTGHQGQCEHHEPGAQAGELYAEKNTLGATERQEAARAAWREQMSGVDANQLVVVDETGSNLDLSPLYGWALKGERA